jgi:predicted RNase H-like HicB family nuclease
MPISPKLSPRMEKDMKHEFTAIIERDGEWYLAYCPEIPGANGQGKTKQEARDSLAEAIALILEDRLQEGLRGSGRSRRRRARDRYSLVERFSLLRHLRRQGCCLKREGPSHVRPMP